jgi:hypothetical protein
LKVSLDERILYHIFDHAQENADLYKVMLRGEGGAKASERMSDLIQSETVKRLENLSGLDTKVPLEVFASFLGGSLIAMVNWWLENDQPYGKERMVEYFQQLFIYGALDTLNIRQPQN